MIRFPQERIDHQHEFAHGIVLVLGFWTGGRARRRIRLDHPHEAMAVVVLELGLSAIGVNDRCEVADFVVEVLGNPSPTSSS
jgi:hypothetical protein